MTEQSKRLLAGGLGLAYWATIFVQFSIVLDASRARGAFLSDAVLTFLTFFTHVTTLLVAIMLALMAVAPDSRHAWNRPSLQSALLLYVAIVALVYAALLQGQWNPQGLRLVTDRLMHVVLPIAYLGFWLTAVAKGRLRWLDPLYWLIVPVVYTIYAIEHGKAVGRYPYPFFNLNKIGYWEMILNSLGLLLFLIVLGFIIVWFDRRQAQDRELRGERQMQ